MLMNVETAKAFITFLTWEINRHKDDIEKLQKDITILTSLFPELEDYAYSIRNDTGFIYTENVKRV